MGKIQRIIGTELISPGHKKSQISYKIKPKEKI